MSKHEVDDTTKLYIENNNKEERKISDQNYAKIIIERLMFGLVSMILVAFFSYLISLVIRR